MEGIIIRIVILALYAGLFIYACLVYYDKIDSRTKSEKELQNYREEYEKRESEYKSPSLNYIRSFLKQKKIEIPNNTQAFFDPTNGKEMRVLSVGEDVDEYYRSGEPESKNSYEQTKRIIKKLTRLESPMLDALAFLALTDSEVGKSLCFELEFAEEYNLIGPLRRDEDDPQWFNYCPSDFCESLFVENDLWNRMRKVAARSHSGFLNYPEDFVDHEHNNSIKNSIVAYPNEGKSEEELFENSVKY